MRDIAERKHASTSSRHLVDQELVEALDDYPAAELDLESLPMVRRAHLMEREITSADGIAVTTRVFAQGEQRAPDVEIVVHVPLVRHSPVPCILYMHGGGYVAGSAIAAAGRHRALASHLGCAVASVEYRLAPETRYPGSLEDCYTALTWIFKNAASIGVNPCRVGLMGESAGGGLAAALALLTRDRGEHQLAFQHLIYPMLDDRTGISKMPHSPAGEFIWTCQNNRFAWASLLGTVPGGPGIPAYAAAARAEDLCGLPDAYISVGTLDLFMDENVSFAQRLISHGVAVELHVYPGAYHAFDILAPDAAISMRARQESHAALNRALHGMGTATNR